MRAVVQRVRLAEVTVDSAKVAAIGRGLLVLVAVGRDDGEVDAEYLAEKISGLRVFPDEQDRMNRSVIDVDGEVLVISQFTLYGDVRRGRRPSFVEAAPPERANELYQSFVQALRSRGIRNVPTGEFRAMMDVSLVNAGPVTILLDSKKTF